MTDEDIEDIVFALSDGIDDMMCAGSFDAIADGLTGVDVATTHTTILVALLSVTLPARDKLGHAREAFAARVRTELARRDHVRVNDLLRGLE